jgi:hypothetical protein
MPTISRPSSDLALTGWTGSYSAIDEVTADDADYITSPDLSAPTPATFALDTPLSAGTNTVRVRARFGGTEGNIQLNLLDNTGTVVGSSASQALTSIFATYSLTVTSSATAFRVQVVVTGPAPATVFSQYIDNPTALMGFATEPSAGRWNFTSSSTAPTPLVYGTLAFRIKGSSASMFAYSGDSTPFRILVDSYTWANYTVPTLSGGKIPLFSGLSDTWHTVFIWPDNSPTGQGFPAPTGNLIEAFGSAAQVLPMGTAWYAGDPAFPGKFYGTVTDTTFFPQPKKQVYPPGYGTSASSVHMRASYTELWVFLNAQATHVNLSINGALAAVCSLSALENAQNGSNWRLVNTPAQSSTVSLIISGGGNETTPLGATAMQGVMVTGAGAQILAPTGARRYVALMGASQVEGVVVGAGGYKTDGHLVQNRLPIYLTNVGSAGATIDGLTAQIPTIAGRLANKDIAMLSIGINSPDDAAFQPSYTACIQACLTNGFTKVVARGLVQVSSNASKNAKIAAAVASFGSANVVYADVSSWVATTDGSGGTIPMPDGSHPSPEGFVTMADYWVRDHSAYFS